MTHVLHLGKRSVLDLVRFFLVLKCGFNVGLRLADVRSQRTLIWPSDARVV